MMSNYDDHGAADAEKDARIAALEAALSRISELRPSRSIKIVIATCLPKANKARLEHDSDCAIYGAPALPVGPCNCGFKSETAPTLICPRCSVDRYKQPCPNHIGCPMVGSTLETGAKP